MDSVWKADSFQVVYARQPFPTTVTKTLFLAGPTPRKKGVEGWRKEALHILRQLGFDGTVFVPEPEDGTWASDYDGQIEWEEEGLNRADCIVFWMPRDITGGNLWSFPMPALTTNDEWGVWKDSGKVVFGAPADAQKVNYQVYFAKKLGVPIANTLPGVLGAAIDKIGEGSLRTGGECAVPLYIWRKKEFQSWYAAQVAAGNRLDGARVVWTLQVPPPAFGLGPPKHLFGYTLHVDVHIGSENRNKRNEVVLFRTDISVVLMYRGNEIVLVREFRSPVRNSAGFVYELPGGSSFKPGEDPRQVAAHEVNEETGLEIEPVRLVEHERRQLVATLSAHEAKLFSVELTQDEIDRLRQDHEVHGVVEDTEQTYVEVKSLKEILERSLLDWSSVGMILSVLH